jgi:hypothetical protein
VTHAQAERDGADEAERAGEEGEERGLREVADGKDDEEDDEGGDERAKERSAEVAKEDGLGGEEDDAAKGVEPCRARNSAREDVGALADVLLRTSATSRRAPAKSSAPS